jgi:very-short-patch-repair endonuclease
MVQGPPGTGKSHTIANLISHLLAHGKRVLVTSETARALAVLKEKLPEHIRHLCVNLLGASSEAFDELTTSINGLTQRHALYSFQEYEARISDLERKLSDARSQLASTDKALLEMREAETRQNFINQQFRGTATFIARQVRELEPAYGWYQGRGDIERPLTGLEARELLHNLRVLTEEVRASLALPTPSIAELPDYESFDLLVRLEERAKDASLRYDDLRGHDLYCELRDLQQSDREQLLNASDVVQVKLREVDDTSQPWADGAVLDMLGGREKPWMVLFDKTNNFFANRSIYEAARQADRTHLTAPDNVPRQQLLEDAIQLRDHLGSGGGWGFLLFKPSAVRGRDYIRARVALNGKKVSSPEAVANLASYLYFCGSSEEVWRYWSAHARPQAKLYEQQVAELAEHWEVLRLVLELRDALNALREALGEAGLATAVRSTIDGLDGFHRFLHAIDAEVSFEQSAEPLRELTALLSNRLTERHHPLAAELKEALDSRDSYRWRAVLERLAELQRERERLGRTNDLLNRLRTAAPETAEKLEALPHDPPWDERLADFERAFTWAQARQWLVDINDEQRQRTLERDHLRLTAGISELTAEVAATRAWQHFLQRLEPQQSQSLQAWRLAITRIGKGTGKSAAHYRRVAQEHMDVCIPAIPAWILPRYRLSEVMSVKRGMFDVVIVDEASQTGIDGLFLNYIADRVVIVGDDQQISPASVGIRHDQVQELQERYLYDVHIGTSVDQRTSLYDIAKVLFQSQSKIVLQEHFRCMPEIIRFSDQLCYSPKGTPLIPLRNYPPHRLMPLKSVYVKSGYQEGTSASSINRPEAETLVEAIVECIEDPAYAGKSLGVISLLGSRQAELINSLLIDAVGPEEIEARNLQCGDAYSFQGDERDVIFLSLVASPEGTRAVRALTTESARQRFNVAASRARDQMWLFHSAKLEHMSTRPDCVRRQLVEFFTVPNARVIEGLSTEKLDELMVQASKLGDRGVAPKPFDSWFEVDVFLELHRRGYQVRPQFPVAQYRIDLVVEGDEGRLAVECDGDNWHGLDRYQDDLRRQRQLERSGWEFFRLRGSQYYMNPNDALEPLWSELERRGISPFTSWPKQETGNIREAREPTSEADLSQSARAALKPLTNGQTPNVSASRSIGEMTPDELDTFFHWASRNPLMTVQERISLSELASKVQSGEGLEAEEIDETIRLYKLAWSRGFRPR